MVETIYRQLCNNWSVFNCRHTDSIFYNNKEFLLEKKKYNVGEKIILAIALLLYVLNVATGIAIKIDYEISDKKAYEVIEQNRAIVSNYDGKFVVMDCEIQGETIIKKRVHIVWRR